MQLLNFLRTDGGKGWSLRFGLIFSGMARNRGHLDSGSGNRERGQLPHVRHELFVGTDHAALEPTDCI
jgi:hypothetical protein